MLYLIHFLPRCVCHVCVLDWYSSYLVFLKTFRDVYLIAFPSLFLCFIIHPMLITLQFKLLTSYHFHSKIRGTDYCFCCYGLILILIGSFALDQAVLNYPAFLHSLRFVALNSLQLIHIFGQHLLLPETGCTTQED